MLRSIMPLPPETIVAPAVTPGIRERLDVFVALIRRWNSTIRLVSARDIPHLWERHIDDALQLAEIFPAGAGKAADLGSGGGLPGLVLALATGIHFDLIEADSRKAAFLREAAIATEAPVTVHARRIEAVVLPACHVVTARALAPLPKLLALAKPLLAADGICLFPKGERVEAEIAAARRCWSFSLDRVPSRTAEAAWLLRIGNVTSTTDAIP
jgi:16S rRNA (guanine527-N7)-methyltransferase